MLASVWERGAILGFVGFNLYLWPLRLFISTSTRGREIELESMPAILIKKVSDRQDRNVSWLSPWISDSLSLHPLLRTSSVPHINSDLLFDV